MKCVCLLTAYHIFCCVVNYQFYLFCRYPAGCKAPTPRWRKSTTDPAISAGSHKALVGSAVCAKMGDVKAREGARKVDRSRRRWYPW